MKKFLASVLSFILAMSASASIPTADISAAYYPSGNKYEDENIRAEVEMGNYGSVFDEQQEKYIDWYSLSYFSSNNPTAYIPSEVNGKSVFDIRSFGCDCTNIENLVLPSKLKIIATDALTSTDSLKYLTVPGEVIDIEDNILPDDLTIRGYIGSYAQAYANKKGYDFQIIGDCDCNGTISASDIIKIKNYLLNTGETLTGDETIMSDYNLDSKINIIDFIYIINNLMSDKTDYNADPNKSAVAAPDYSSAVRTADYKNEGFNDFTAKTITALYKNNDTENEVCSPLSLYMALSQAAECTDGETLSEFLEVLGASSLDELRTDNSDLFNSLYFDELSRYMKIANSVWINDIYTVEQEPIEMLAQKYFTAVFSENFSQKKEVSDKISNWISDNTGGKFKPDIEVDPTSDIMKIINTVNYKNTWIDNFSNAADGTFTKKDGSNETCKFLKNIYDSGTVGIGDDYTKFSIAMHDRYKMNFILPDEDSTVNDIVSDSDTLLEIINDTMTKKSARVIFSVPKFDVKSKYEFSDTAKELGIRNAFDRLSADFSRAIDPDKNNGTGAYISDIIHEAGIAIDEKGCEAAAFTLLEIENTGFMTSDEINFELDRPFIYYVSDNNGTPVFMGIINDPS
ncbi:MAG: serpin family protein [Oscillospiraceae bacterium]|nr:serpin family protein [Oscillospiraceae bacterium]